MTPPPPPPPWGRNPPRPRHTSGLWRPPRPASASAAGGFSCGAHFFVRATDSRTVSMHAAWGDTVGAVLAHLADRGYGRDLRLVYAGRQLAPETALADLRLPPDSTLNLLSRLRSTPYPDAWQLASYIASTAAAANSSSQLQLTWSWSCAKQFGFIKTGSGAVWIAPKNYTSMVERQKRNSTTSLSTGSSATHYFSKKLHAECHRTTPSFPIRIEPSCASPWSSASPLLRKAAKREGEGRTKAAAAVAVTAHGARQRWWRLPPLSRLGRRVEVWAALGRG
ncbi:hypothetical protein OsJ_29800 [Oryza sativa Japonica Group]|uniref:Ubiquitin-like domain-containing protein n=1 Tax=Oryza sativa subsp. japonica TaxID=39947 RepID=B9G485_ORYSJ|nr:hypothetical protein OsJ_29800 [Oryza sativa Japonica Group]